MRCPFQARQQRFFLPVQQTGKSQSRAFLQVNFKKSTDDQKKTAGHSLQVGPDTHKGLLEVAIRKVVLPDALSRPRGVDEGPFP